MRPTFQHAICCRGSFGICLCYEPMNVQIRRGQLAGKVLQIGEQEQAAVGVVILLGQSLQLVYRHQVLLPAEWPFCAFMTGSPLQSYICAAFCYLHMKMALE